MFKILFRSFIGFAAVLILASLVSPLADQVFANSAVSIRLEQPKTPTNQNSLNITFVTLDTQSEAITVKCFKKGPTDGAFSQFGADINLAAGGNTGTCDANSSVINTPGSYQFYATATAASGNGTSSTVNVDYNNSGPGTPTNFSKDRITSCSYKIKFRTADDSGKTIKVRIYRADATASDPSSTSEVGAVNIGSSTDGEFTNTIPDCSKSYYYAVRAFDSAGNASGVVGDSINIGSTTTTTTTTTGTTGASPTAGTGAIPVGAGQGSVPGEQTNQNENGTKQEVLGASTPSGKTGEMEKKNNATVGSAFSSKKLFAGAIAIIVVIAGVAYILYRRGKKTI